MKTTKTEYNIDQLGFEQLNTEEMLEIKGGIIRGPRSRDKDLYDLEEE